MVTYGTLDGKVLDLGSLNEEQQSFFDRCYGAYQDGMGWDQFGVLITSRDNPVVRDAGGRVTRAVWEHPLFQAVRDLEDRIGIKQGELDPDPGTEVEVERDPLADEWLPTARAADQKGVSYSGLNHAIKRGDVVARPAKPGGTHLLVSVRSLERWQPMSVRQRAGRASRQRAAS